LVKVKICGITNLKDAKVSVDAGCDALGFVFYKKSPRYIIPEKAEDIIKQLPAHVLKIGVFVNTPEKVVKRIAKLCHLDILQFHGDESAQFCQKFKNYRIIKVFRIKDKIELPKILRYKVFAYLFDTHIRSKIGGTGKKFNWRLLENLSGIKKHIFLSGGLNEKNVQKAIKLIRPDWVDVSSSVEIRPGEKSHKRVKNFIHAARKKI